MANQNESKLTVRQLEELGRALREKRDELRARQVELDEQRIMVAEPDVLDMASEETAGAEGEALSAHDTFLLAEIDGALTRLAEGRYGVSEESGEPIPIERLRLIPWARRTTEEEGELQRDDRAAAIR